MNPKASIIIDNYNYGRYLRQAIDSALAQTYPHTEVVVVDDGSTDDSAEIIRSYGDRVRAVFKQNGGQASAFNAGFARSSGEIIAFLDADDYFSPAAVERIVSLWRDDTDILHHRLRVFGSSPPGFDYWPSLKYTLDSGDVRPLLLNSGFYCHPPATGLVYSRGILEKILPVPEEDCKNCADLYLLVVTPFFGQVTTLEEPVAYFRAHETNMIGLAHTLTRRTLTPAMLKKTTNFNRLRFSLIRKMAAKFRLPVAYFPMNGILFGELLLHRASPSGSSLKERTALYGGVLKHLWSEPGVSWRQRAQKTVAGSIIWLGPRPLLRLIYPGMFADKT